MSGPLNSPIEIGLRALVILAAAFPESCDLDSLALLDYGLLHSADLGGPPSLHPSLPIRVGELGLKRAVMEEGLRMMARAGLVEVKADSLGIRFQASESAASFVHLLETEYASELVIRAEWVARELSVPGRDDFRRQMQALLSQWLEQIPPRAPVPDREV